MKVKNIIIGIRSVAEGLKEFTQAAHSIERGVPPRARKEGVFFVSLEAMRRVLTPKRLELLHVIREKHPESVYELARMARRDLKNVQGDVAMLSRIGLVSLTRSMQARARMIPRVEYDQLQLHVPVI